MAELDPTTFRPETRALHAGQKPDPTTNARAVPIGIEGDILYGPRQVRSLVDAAGAARVHARYREIRSSKGHDAFLVEWDQLTSLLREALDDR